MILSDVSIKKMIKQKAIKIKPFKEECLQPASYDVHLGDTFLVFDNTSISVIDPKKPVSNIMRKIKASENKPFILHPKEFALASTVEIIGVDSNHVCILNGKSSLARLGLIIHATAGYIDPGNELRITLELYNMANAPILLYPNMKIAQVVFETLTQKCEIPYGHPKLKSKYYKSKNVVESQMFKNFK